MVLWGRVISLSKWLERNADCLKVSGMFAGMKEKEKDEQNRIEDQTDRVTKDTTKSKDWAAADLEKVCFYFIY